MEENAEVILIFVYGTEFGVGGGALERMGLHCRLCSAWRRAKNGL